MEPKGDVGFVFNPSGVEGSTYVYRVGLHGEAMNERWFFGSPVFPRWSYPVRGNSDHPSRSVARRRRHASPVRAPSGHRSGDGSRHARAWRIGDFPICVAENVQGKLGLEGVLIKWPDSLLPILGRRIAIPSDSPKILAAMDRPSIDGVTTWFVSRAAAEAGLMVVLSGLGGDEVSGRLSLAPQHPQLGVSNMASRPFPGVGSPD